MKDGVAASDDQVRLIIATIYLNHSDVENALRTGITFYLFFIFVFIIMFNLVRGSNDLECLALAVQAYLQLNRPDLAEKELKTMQVRIILIL